jgi:hypothetical protein
MTKNSSCLFLAILFFAGMALPVFAAPQSPGELGKITIPKDFELDTMMDTDILSPGEYLLSLFDERLSLSYRDKTNGLEYGFGIPTEVERTKEDIRPTKIDVTIIREAGADHVRIQVFSGLKIYTSLLRCASDGKPEMLSPESLASLDPRIIAELNTLKEAVALLDRSAGTIWPNWTEYKGLQFSMIFPNRTKLIVTNKERLPALFKQMDIVMPGGKKIFINRSKEIPGSLGPFTGFHAGGDSSGVGITFTGMINSGKDELSNVKNVDTSEDLMRFSRMMTYVHEAFHVMQHGRVLEAEIKGLSKNRGIPDRNFVTTPDFSLHSEIEGEALIKAFSETNDAKALEYFKDFLVARELKLKEMSASAAAFDAGNTLIEGSATYSSFKMAMLIQDAGLDKKAAEGQDPKSAALARTGDYLNKEMKGAIYGLKMNTSDVIQKHYIYGAYWCLLLDRFSPSWKQGLFENNRSLDEVTADFMKMTDAEKTGIAGRLKTDFEYEKIRARHTQVIKERDDAIASITNRKGKSFLIDLKHAQSGFDINPRQFILNKGEQIYPRGLAGFVFGSLKLKSEETPMRLIMKENLLEWIDTEAKPGEKGYDLKYNSHEGDVYKDVTLTTKGFSMTAKAIKIAEDGDTVKISIWD